MTPLIVGEEELMAALKILNALDPDDRLRVLRTVCAFYGYGIPATSCTSGENTPTGSVPG